MKIIKNFLIKVVVIFILTILLAIIGSWTYLKYMNSILTKSKEERLYDVSSQVKNIIKEKLILGIDELEDLSNIVTIESGYDINNMESILSNHYKTSTFTKIAILKTNGEVLGDNSKQMNFSNREYFQKALNGEKNISEILSDGITGDLESVFSVPIYDENRKVIGVLVGSRNLTEFNSMLNTSIYEGKGNLLIVDSNGSIIGTQKYENYNYDIQNINQLDFINNEDFIDSLINDSRGILTITDSYSDNKYLVYESLGINDWYILSIVSTSIIDSNVQHLYKVSIVMLIILFTILLLIIYFTLYSKRKSEIEIEKISFIDQVTNGPNYNAFELEFKSKIKNSENISYALVSLDIDRFKIFNDMFGYSNGNVILKSISNCIKDKLSDKELYCRLNADNFLILLEWTSKDEVSNKIQYIVNNILNKSNDIIRDIKNSRSEYKLILKYGIYIINDKDSSLDVCVDRANLAKDTVKVKHKNIGAFYTKDLSEKILFNKELESCMEIALKEKQFKVYFQPEVSFEDGSIIGAEALVRWQHPERGLIFPNDFIPLFEKNNFITKLDYYMFDEVSKYIEKWQKLGIPLPKMISINLSRVHISDIDLAKRLESIVKKHNIDPSRIGIELTESALIGDEKSLIKMIDKLRDVGFKIYLDDFGSGYSCLSTLKDLNVDYLKFDKNFLIDLENNKKGQLILYNLVSMAKDINISTVAEGVETISQVEFLKEKGFDIAQGYYYYKSMSAMEMMSKLREGAYIAKEN